MPNAVSLQDLEAQPDALEDSRFLLIVDEIPGVGYTQDLSLAIDSITWPGLRTAVIEFKLFGHTRHWRGDQTPGDGRIQITLNENVTMSIYNKLIAWSAAGSDPETGASDPNFQTISSLFVFDTTGAVAGEAILYNLWCEEVQATTLSGQSSKVMQITATLCFDYYDINNAFFINLSNGGSGSGLSSLGSAIYTTESVVSDIASLI